MMKRKILSGLVIMFMLLVTISSALAETVIPENDGGDVTATSFFGSVQQTVIPSQKTAVYGDVVTFSFITTAEASTDRAIYVYEKYLCPSGLDCNTNGIYQNSWQSTEFSTQQGKTYQTSGYKLYVSTALDVGTYRIVAYIYDRANGRVISAENDYASLQVLGEGLTDSDCIAQYEGTCNSDIGTYTNCRVSSLGTSCECDTDSCATREVCQDGTCIASSECEPDIFSFSSTCDEETNNECGDLVTRNTDGITCGVESKCVNGDCVKSCTEKLVGDYFCNDKRTAVLRMKKLEDCTTVETTVESCSSGFYCEAGQCIEQVIENPEETTVCEQDIDCSLDEVCASGTCVTEQNPEPITVEDDFGSSSGSESSCVLDTECGLNFVCESGDCVRQAESSNTGFAIVILSIVGVVILLYGFNAYTSRKGKRRKR